MPLVRIVIPTFNRAAETLAAIESARSQTFTDFEIVVVDDGSSDGTVDRLQPISAEDPRVVVVAAPHGGVAAARNIGLATSGDYRYVAFLDADDRWTRDHLQTCVTLLEREPEVALVFGLYETKDLTGTWTEEDLNDRRQRVRRPIEWASRQAGSDGHILDVDRMFSALLQSRFFPHTSTLVIRAGGIGTRHWFDTTMVFQEDAEFLLRLAATRAPWAFIDREQCTVRFLGDNLTRARDLASPATLERLRCVQRYASMKLGICTVPADRAYVREELSRKAYIVGQCCAEQNDWRGARQAYVDSLKASVNYLAAKGFVASCMPQSALVILKGLKAQG